MGAGKEQTLYFTVKTDYDIIKIQKAGLRACPERDWFFIFNFHQISKLISQISFSPLEQSFRFLFLYFY